MLKKRIIPKLLIKHRTLGPVVRPVVKVLVFGLAPLGLWVAGHHGWAVALLAFSVVVNGLAQLPAVRALVTEAGARC